jgi:hypothetical protein
MLGGKENKRKGYCEVAPQKHAKIPARAINFNHFKKKVLHTTDFKY